MSRSLQRVRRFGSLLFLVLGVLGFSEVRAAEQGILQSTIIGAVQGNSDLGHRIVLNASGDVLLAGYPLGLNAPTTPNAFDRTFGVVGETLLIPAYLVRVDGLLNSLEGATFFDGTGQTWATDLALDPSGNVIIVGFTTASNLPMSGDAYCDVYDHPDAGGQSYRVFVAKFAGDCSNLIAATYWPRGYDDASVAVDATGNVFVASKIVDSISGCGVAKFSNDLSTLLGYRKVAHKNMGYYPMLDVCLGPENRLYVGGTIFPGTDLLGKTAATFDGRINEASGPSSGACDGFVTLLSAVDLSIVEATYVGGDEGDGVDHLAVAPNGELLVAGGTNSADLPMRLPSFQASAASSGGSSFVMRFSRDLRTLDSATYYGSGNGFGTIGGLAVGGDGSVWITGKYHISEQLAGYGPHATYGAVKARLADEYGDPSDAFVTHLSPRLDVLIASTLLGGHGADEGKAIALDGDGRVLVMGLTSSVEDADPANPPFPAFPTTTGCLAAAEATVSVPTPFLTRLSPDLMRPPDPGPTMAHLKVLMRPADAMAIVTGPGINLPGDGDEDLEVGTIVNLRAVPQAMPPTWIFDHWESVPLRGSYFEGSFQIREPTTVVAVFRCTERGGRRSGNTEDPVSTASGEFHFDVADLEPGGPMSLCFVRQYGSLVSSRGLNANFSSLGPNWTHNFDLAIVERTAEAVDVFYRDGQRLAFLFQDGGWRADFANPLGYELKRSDGTWFFLDPSTERIFVFDGEGKLTTILDRSGNALVLTWSGGTLSSVSDGLGRSLTFTRSGGRITMVSDGTRSVRFAYDGNGVLTSAIGEDDATTTYEVDAGGHGWILRVVRPLGNWHTRQTYDAYGRVTKQETPTGEMTRLSVSVDVSGSCSSTVTNFDGSTARHVHGRGALLESVEEGGRSAVIASYDEEDRLTEVGDEDGAKMKLAYGCEGEPVAVADGKGGLRRMIWADSVETVTDPVSGHSTTFTFRNLVKVIGPDGNCMEWTYDAYGRVSSRTEASDATWTYAYDGKGNLVTVTNPLGGRFQQEWNGNGTLRRQRDGDTDWSTYTYDGGGRLVRVDRPDGTFSQVSYDEVDRILTSRDDRGSITEYVYDSNGNVRQWKLPGGAVVSWTYDECDRPVSVSTSGEGVTTAAYDGANRLVSLDPPGADRVSYIWNAQRRVVSSEGPDGTEIFGEGPSPLTTRVVDESGGTTSYAFDALGLPRALTDALGRTVRMERDAWGNVLSIVDPDGRTTRFTYDSVGNVASVEKVGLGTIHYERNALGRISRVTDFEGAAWIFGYTSMGRLAATTDPLGRCTRYLYDSVGRLLETSFPDGETLVTTYDGGTLPVRRTWSDGPDLTYRYDADGRLVEAVDQLVEYDVQGRVTACTSRGERIASTWDSAGRLATLSCDDGAFRVTYGYDGRTGRLASVEDDVSGTRFTFSYDSCGRVTGIDRSTGVRGTYTWNAAGEVVRIVEGDFVDIGIQRDGAGRVVTKGGVFAMSPSALLVEEVREQDYDGASQPLGHTLDARGRLLASPNHTYLWDGASRLLGIDGKSLEYDGCLELVAWRDSSGAQVRGFRTRAIDGNPVIAQKRDGETEFHRYYVYAPDGSLLWSVEPGSSPKVRCYHFDDRGDTVALTDENGIVTDRYAYTAFAERSGHEGATDQPFRFGGQYGVLTTLDHVHMRARWYEPVTGRFLSPDPLLVSPANPEVFSVYAYGADDPVNRVDPNGRAPVGAKAIGALGRVGKAFLGESDAVPKFVEHVKRINLAAVFRVVCNADNLKSVGKELVGRLKPNKTQVCSGVPMTSKLAALAHAMLFFIPGYSAIDRGEGAEVPAQAAWDMTMAGPVAVLTVPSAVLETIIEEGEPNTHGIWDFGRLWEMHQCGVGIEPSYRAFMGAVCSYGRDFYVVGYRTIQQTAVAAERTTVSVVSYPFKVVGAALRSWESGSRPLQYEHPAIHDERYYMRGR